MIVEELWRYPVKSLGGEKVTSCRVDEFGLRADRRWALRDCSTGLFLTARREPELLMASARSLPGGLVEVILPDGRGTTDDDKISDWLGKPVTLCRAPEEGAEYESPGDSEAETEWYAWTGPGHALHDELFARVSFVSRNRLKQNGWDSRRIRSNVIISGGDDRDLVGETVQIGGAEIKVTAEIPRCLMVSRPQPGLEKDVDVLRTINNVHGGYFTSGGAVIKKGDIAVGDELIF